MERGRIASAGVRRLVGSVMPWSEGEAKIEQGQQGLNEGWRRLHKLENDAYLFTLLAFFTVFLNSLLLAFFTSPRLLLFSPSVPVPRRMLGAERMEE